MEAAFREAAFQVMLGVAQMLSVARMGNVGELKTIARRALVQAAVVRAQADGRKASITDIAIETGISRNDVSRLMKDRAAPPRFVRGGAIADYVLSHWWSQARDPFGRPTALDMSGFVDLLKRLNISAKRASPILSELVRAAAVQRLKDGRLKPVRQTCVTARWDRDNLLSVGAQTRRFLEALLDLKSANSTEMRFVRIIESEPLIESGAARLANEFIEGAQILLDGTTDSFPRYRDAAPSGHAKAKRIVAALQLFTEPVGVSVTAPRNRKRGKPPRGHAAKKRRPPSGVGAA